MHGGRANRLRAVVLAVLISACGDGPAGPDPLIAPFVGSWEATALVLTSPLSDLLSVDLIEFGSTFDLDIQPSGGYTAILVFAGQAQTEIGTITVTPTTVTLHRDFPTKDTAVSTYEFVGDATLILDGDTEFDFNLDGTNDPALVHFELVRK